MDIIHTYINLKQSLEVITRDYRYYRTAIHVEKPWWV